MPLPRYFHSVTDYMRGRYNTICESVTLCFLYRTKLVCRYCVDSCWRRALATVACAYSEIVYVGALEHFSTTPLECLPDWRPIFTRFTFVLVFIGLLSSLLLVQVTFCSYSSQLCQHLHQVRVSAPCDQTSIMWYVGNNSCAKLISNFSKADHSIFLGYADAPTTIMSAPSCCCWTCS